MQENYQIEISQSNLLAITGLVLLLIIKLHCSCSRQECIQFVKISAKLDPCCKKKMIIPGSLYPKSDVSVLLLLRISYCSVDKSAYVQIAIIRMEEAFEAVEFISLLSQAMHTLRSASECWLLVRALAEYQHHAGTRCKCSPPVNFLLSSRRKLTEKDFNVLWLTFLK